MRAGSTSGGSKTNDRIGVLLVAVIALVPIPFGSNRPAFWALWALVAAAALLLFRIGHGSGKARERFSMSGIRLQQALFLLVGSAMLLQILPVGALLPFPAPIRDLVDPVSPSLSPGDTWLAFLKWATYGLLFVLTLQVGVRAKRNRFIASAIVAVVAVEALYALAALTIFGDTILVFEKTTYLGAATGTFVNRNSLATFLGIGAVLALSEILRDRSLSPVRAQREYRIMFALAFVLCMAALLATQSRMGLLATCLGLLTVVLLLRRSLPGVSRYGLLLIAAAIAALGFLYGEQVLDRSIFIESSAVSRGELYRQVLAMIAERPLLGYGADTFRLVFPIFAMPPLRSDVTWEYAHSTYLDLWSGLGLIAGSLPVLLVASLAFRMARVWKREGQPRSRSPGSAIPAALGATVLVGVHALVDFSLEMQAVAVCYTLTLALGMAETTDGRTGRDVSSN